VYCSEVVQLTGLFVCLSAGSIHKVSVVNFRESLSEGQQLNFRGAVSGFLNLGLAKEASEQSLYFYVISLWQKVEIILIIIFIFAQFPQVINWCTLSC